MTRLVTVLAPNEAGGLNCENETHTSEGTSINFHEPWP